MSTREMVVRRTPRAGALNARIAVVSGVVVAQFWGLAATLDAWLTGDSAAVTAVIGFQAACAGTAYAVRRIGHRDS
jgi:hypothetical protein